MEVNANLAQDVFKDAGESVIFVMLSLKREDIEKEREIIADMADRMEAIQRSMNIRVAPETVKLSFGFSNRAWEYLFPTAKKPKELEDFQGVNGEHHTAPATPADLFLHVRAGQAATSYLVVDQIMSFFRPVVDVVDETHGFHYLEGRAIIDFIDGTENPVGEEAKEWAIIGAEDPEFINGSYAFAQKYIHDLDAWRALPTEVQEKYVGRRKYSDLELSDEEKDPRAHNIISQDNRDGEEHKIVRMNVVFANPGEGVRGTYFIGYARHWNVTRQMVTNMFTQDDRLLEYSTAEKGQLFFIPSKEILGRIAEGELF
ncbi:Dyp-type peroxidase [Selenomonas sp. CM52]|uniref:Dyp-type peroxidase n=1 Tax=Selenomonas sp. CM52 TaxID=936381 RepID=UPI00027C3FF2|nr:Dyp-type peroxidase [Selenomonas sp. CM52]EJU28062.1 Dyp-type peroxidase family protein [Selenomonas sp. CM52]